MHISFVTTVKICSGYEFLETNIQLYVQHIQYYCQKYNIEYEIIICEQVDDKNTKRVSSFLKEDTPHVKITVLEQTYPNPLSFNMLESYGKNAGLKQSSGKYVCMTSADQILSEPLFVYIKHELKPQMFYRFATFEVPELPETNMDGLMEFCQNTNDKVLCNPGCFLDSIGAIDLGQKAGDIMLLDRSSWMQIRGWPEYECFVHVDTAVCFVIVNNFDTCIPRDTSICTYTPRQTSRDHKEDRFVLLKNKLFLSYDEYQTQRCLAYRDKLVSNDQPEWGV
jgi:hypothetical protein